MKLTTSFTNYVSQQFKEKDNQISAWFFIINKTDHYRERGHFCACKNNAGKKCKSI